jgi:hypothetical protein
MMQHLWPIHTGITIFDYWALSHLAFWFVVGSSTAAMNDDARKSPADKWIGRIFTIASSIFVAVLWEFFERHAEKQWPAIWQSPESEINVAFDVVTVLIGLIAAWWGYSKWRPK